MTKPDNTEDELDELIASQVPAIALYLAEKGQAYRTGMKEMLDYIEENGKAVIRFLD